MTSIITTLYKKFSFRVLTVPLIIFSIEFLIWAVLIRENVISGGWAIYRTSLFACVLALLATGFIFQNSDYLKAAIGLLVCLALGFLILVMCYIGSLDFSFLTAKMITIFMMASFGSQIITCIIGKVDI